MGGMRQQTIQKSLLRTALAAVLLAAVSSVQAAPVKAEAQAARAGKGILVLQTGCDWCVSGEQVRKVFESSEFRRAVGSKFLLFVYDEMDAPTDAVKESNDLLSNILIRTKRFPAITCYAAGQPLRVFAQMENVSNDVTALTLSKAVAENAARREQAEALFKKASYAKGEKAADFYGAAFDILVGMMGPFHANEVTTGKCGWTAEWKALSELDANDSFGWLKHFEMDEHKCVSMVEKVTDERKNASTALLDKMLRVPQTHFTANQRQCIKILEYAATTDGTDKPLKASEKIALKAAFEMGRNTFWGQYAMGRLMMDGEKIESKGLASAPLRARPPASTIGVKASFGLDRARNKIDNIKPTAVLTEPQKLAVARHAALRLIGQKGWDALVARPGSAPFVKAFMNDRVWLEDFAWSGTFPENSSDGWARAGSGPGDGAAAVLALEALVFQDAGKWVPFVDGMFTDNEGRRFMTALALAYPDKDEEWLADVLDAYRATAKAGRLHKSAYTQPVWLWRFAVHQGHGTASVDNMAAQQRHLDMFANLPLREYGGACWMIQYRSFNCFGDSVQGPLYYKPWATAGEWPKRRYSQIVGGVCGELSKFGSAVSNAHGLPSTTAGQPGHCAYTRRLPEGRWEVDYSVTGHSQMHMCFWDKHPWQYSVAIEKTFVGDREKRLAADRLLELALVAEARAAKASDVEAYYRQACRSWPTHYGAWKAYGDWVSRTDASLDTMRIWVRGCARGMKTGRQPLWDFLTPYFARLSKEKGIQALADDLVVFAPLLRQSGEEIQEESDLKVMLTEWAKPLGSDPALVAPVLKAMLLAQYGTKDYFSQVLGWGGDVMMGDKSLTALYIKTLGEVVVEKSKGGSAAALDFNPLMLSASKSDNLDAFRQMALLQDKLEPYKGDGKSYPASDFGGQLVSAEGLLKTSSTSGWDKPKNYARCIDATPCGENGFHTAKEKAPWAVVMLPGPVQVCGVVAENKAGQQNRHRQAPLELQVSEDGTDWTTVHSDGQVRETYRIDLRSAAPRARYVRIRRVPDAKDEVYHLNKLLVYGKKLY